MREGSGGGSERRLLGPAFWNLVAATAGSSFGDGLVAVGFPLLAYGLSHSALAVSVVYACARLPDLALGVVAGVWADRRNRRRLAIGSDCARLVIVLLVGLAALTGIVSIVMLCVAVAVLGAFEQLYRASTFAALPTMVVAEELDRANGRLWVADSSVEEVVGQGLGGLLLALGRSIPFLLDAASFGWSALFLRKALPADLGGKVRDGAGGSTAALRWFARQPLLRATAVLISSFAFCQAAVLAVLVVYVRRDLHQSPTAYGLLLAIGALGTMAGSLSTERVVAWVGSVGALLLGGGGAAAAYLILGLFHSVVGVAAALVVEAAATNLGIVASVSLRQRLIPPEMLGRVGMIMRTTIFAGMPLGALAAGALTTLVSLPVIFLAAGAVQAIVLASWTADWRRRSHSLASAAPNAEAAG